MAKGFLILKPCKLCFLCPLKNICIWKVVVCVLIPPVHSAASGATSGHIRLLSLVQGSPIGVKITKHLLYYTGVCLVWVRGTSTAEALEFWIQPAQPCPPLLSCTASSILSRLPVISFSPPQCFTMSLFLYCCIPRVIWSEPFPLRLSVYGNQKSFFFCFLREMFWG